MAANDDDKGMRQARGKRAKDEPGLNKKEPLYKPMDRKQFRFTLWYFLFMLIGLFVFNTVFGRPKIEFIDYSDFKARIASGEIHRIEIGEKYVTGFTLTKTELDAYGRARFSGQKPTAAPTTFRTVRTTDPDLIPLMDKKGVEYYAISAAGRSWLGTLLSWVLPIVLMVAFWNYMSKKIGSPGQGVMSFGGRPMADLEDRG